MRFAYLSCDFGVRAFGGAGSSVHVRETVAALRRLGHEVDVFTGRSTERQDLNPAERRLNGRRLIVVFVLAMAAVVIITMVTGWLLTR